MGIVFTEWIEEGDNYERYQTILKRFWDEEFDTYDDPHGQFDVIYRDQLGIFQKSLTSGDVDIRRGIPYLWSGAKDYFESMGIDLDTQK